MIAKTDSVKVEFYTQEDGLSSDSISCIFQDDQGFLWIGTQDGLNKFDGKTFQKFKKNDIIYKSLSSNLITSITQDPDGYLFIGTSNGGLNIFDRRCEVLQNINYPESFKFWDNKLIVSCSPPNIKNITFISKEKNIWLATDQGKLIRFNSAFSYANNEIILDSLKYSEIYITSLIENEKSNLCIGTKNNGIYNYISETKEIKVYNKTNSNLRTNHITSLCIDNSNQLWIGTLRGLYLFNENNNDFKFMESSKNKFITCIYEDNSNNILIGIKESGIKVFDKITYKLNDFFKIDALSNLNISKYLQHNNQSFSANYHFTPTTIFEDKQGILWIGTVENGLMRFIDLTKIKKHQENRNPVIITSFLVGEKEFKFEASNQDSLKNKIKIDLSYFLIYKKNSYFTFKFTHLDFIDPGKITYTYKLEGFDKDWVKSGNINFAQYTNLDAGNYTFKVKAANSNGVLTSIPAEIQIRIAPPIWQTGWAIILFVIMIILSYLGYGKFKTINLNKIKVQEQIKHINGLTKIGIALSSEHDLNHIFEMIVTESMDYTKADGGTVFTLTDDRKHLKFQVVFTKSKNLWLTSRDTKLWPFLPLFNEDGSERTNNLPSFVMHKGVIQKMDDIYSQQEFDYSGTKKYDQSNDYRTKSMIAVPLKDYHDEILGIIQLINAMNAKGEIVSFTQEHIAMLNSLASQAAIALTNKKLILTINEEKTKLTDSIQYASLIQNSILPRKEELSQYIKDFFIIWKPRDIVGGDFYWFYPIQDTKNYIISVIDCTGHGVPGAFMSMTANSILNNIVREKQIYEPDEILNLLHKEIRYTLRQQAKESQQDGMDISLCFIDVNRKEIHFSGAIQSLYFVRISNIQQGISNDEVIIERIRGDRFSIGGRQKEEERIFTNHKIQYNSGDSIYLLSDGLADQKIKIDGKETRLKTKRVEQMFLKYYKLRMKEQKEKIDNELMELQGEIEQRDDIMILGVEL